MNESVNCIFYKALSFLELTSHAHIKNVLDVTNWTPSLIRNKHHLTVSENCREYVEQSTRLPGAPMRMKLSDEANYTDAL